MSFNKVKEYFNMWLSIALVLLVAYSILGWSLYFLQSSFVYKPTKNLLYNPGDLNLTYEKIVLKTEDGLKLSAWFIPAENARQTILFCHGNAVPSKGFASITLPPEGCNSFPISPIITRHGACCELELCKDRNKFHDYYSLCRDRKTDPRGLRKTP